MKSKKVRGNERRNNSTQNEMLIKIIKTETRNEKSKVKEVKQPKSVQKKRKKRQ